MMSDAGINWSDLDILSDAGINWLDIGCDERLRVSTG